MTKRQDILHVCPLPSLHADDAIGGVGPYMFGLLELLRQDINHVILCNAGANIEEIHARIPDVQVVPAWRFGDKSYPGQLIDAIGKHKADIIHIQHELFLFGRGGIALCFPLLLWRLRDRKNVVITVHGVVTPADIDRSLMRGRNSIIPFRLIRGVLTWIFRRIATSRTHKIVHSAELAKRLIELGAADEDITVIEIPLSRISEKVAGTSTMQARSQLGFPEDSQIIITWGFWNSYKGHSVLVEGFREYRRTHSNARLLIGAGPHPQLQSDPSYMRAYESEMSKFAEVDGVEVLGFIDAEKLPLYVRAADVSVFAYTKYLAASGPLAFSMSVGTPVLLSSVFVDVPALLQFELTPTALAEKLTAFFEHRERYVSSSNELAFRAADDSVRAKYLQLYRKLSCP